MLPSRSIKSLVRRMLHLRCCLLLIQLTMLFLLITNKPVSCSRSRKVNTNSSRIEQAPLDDLLVQQEQVDLRRLPEVESEAVNEINRVQDKCSSARQSLDSCSAQLMDISTGSMQNMQEINDIMCPRFREITVCIKNSTDCYKPFEKQIINWVLTSSRRMNHKRCKNEAEKQKFLRLTQSCFATKNPMNKCMSTYIASLEAIANLNKFIERLSEDDVQIQLSCCANMRFKQCVMTNAKNYCKSSHEGLRKLQRANSVSSQRVVQKYLQRSNYDMMEDLRQSLDTMALTGPEFICQSVDESFCQAKFDGRFQLRRPRHKSIVPAMISIYSNNPQ